MLRDVLADLLAAVEAHEGIVLATDLATGEQAVIRPLGEPGAAGASWPIEEARRALLADRSGVVEASRGRVFLRPYNPPVRVVMVGAVHIAQALARFVADAGYRPVVVDPRAVFATETRFPDVELVRLWPEEALERIRPDHRTAVVTLSHDPKFDDPALAGALGSRAFYVGALGSRRTHGKRLERLRDRGIGDEALARIHAPVGLDIGARTPEEIAISVLAEIVAALRGGA